MQCEHREMHAGEETFSMKNGEKWFVKNFRPRMFFNHEFSHSPNGFEFISFISFWSEFMCLH